MEEQKIFVGIDVSKERLVVGLRPHEKDLSAANNRLGIAKIVQRLATIQPACIVVEASCQRRLNVDPL